MKLSIKAFALTAAIIWSLAILIVGCANLAWPTYGGEFLELISSIYPGYETGTGVKGIIVSSLYGVVDANNYGQRIILLEMRGINQGFTHAAFQGSRVQGLSCAVACMQIVLFL